METFERKSQILLVEDEAMIAQVQQAYLQNAGFLVHWHDKGDAVIEAVKIQKPDLVILDVMIPDKKGRDGMALCREMPFAAVARVVGLSWHRVAAICKRYVDLGLQQADFSEVKRLAADETSKARGHDYITLVADADQHRVLFVTEGKDAETIRDFATDFAAHGGDPAAVESISIDMSPAFIKGVTHYLPSARITFDKFHVIAHANTAVEKTRRIEQRTDPSLKGLRWKLLRDRASLTVEARADLDAFVAQVATKRTARAWLYKEQLREIMERKQVNVVRTMLTQWASNVMRSKVESAPFRGLESTYAAFFSSA